jgi:hypothetical protein
MKLMFPESLEVVVVASIVLSCRITLTKRDHRSNTAQDLST